MDLFNEVANLALPAGNNMNMEKTPRKLRRSCELCRNSKGRCNPTKDENGRCERCIKEGKECIFLETKPRPKRAKNSRIRVAEMEEKINGIFSLLASNRPLLDGANSPLPLDPSLSSLSSLSSNSPLPLPYSQNPAPTFSNFQPHSFVFDDAQDVISRGLVTLEAAEQCLVFFRAQAAQFPFVVVESHMTVECMRRERPFLLLAILAFSTQTNPKLQQHIELELRETLSRRVVVKMEKSLDILLGLLVYLAWHHLYFQPERDAIYQLTQMAVSMAVDLGIQKPNRHTLHSEFRAMSTPGSEPCATDIERKRTLLGCYYLASAIGQNLRKPSNLRYDDYTEECCRVLTESAVTETDYLIQYFVRLQQFGDEVYLAFDYDQVSTTPQLEPGRIEVLAKAFNQQLRQIEEDFPADVWNNPSITTSFFNLRIYVNEIGFYMFLPSTTPSDTRSLHFCAVRRELLTDCLRATHTFLDHVINLPVLYQVYVNLANQLQMLYAVLMLGSFATAGLTLDILPNDLSHYLDTIGARCSLILPNGENGNVRSSSIFPFLKRTKAWYEQRMRQINDQEPKDGMDISFTQVLPTVVSRCLEGELMSPVGGENWSNLLPKWPQGFDTPRSLADYGL